jgi:hypothetical protein
MDGGFAECCAPTASPYDERRTGAGSVPAAHRRLRPVVVGGGDAEAFVAGEFEGEVVFVDPDVAAVFGFGVVVAEAEVEGAMALVAEGGVVLG